MGKDAPIDAAIEKALKKKALNMAEDAVEQVIEQRFGGENGSDEPGMVPPVYDNPQEPDFVPGFFDESTDPVTIEEDEKAKELVNKLPFGGSAYVKLYKFTGTGTLKEFKMKIDDFQHWTDAEAEIKNLLDQNSLRNPAGWGSGKYMAMFFMSNGRVYGKPYTIIYDDSDVKIKAAAMNTNPPQGNLMDEIAKMKMYQETLGVKTDPAEMFRLAADAIKGIAGKQDSSDSNQMMNQMLLMMKMMKELGLIGNAPPPPPTLIEQIQTMKALGLIPDKTENDPVKQIDTMVELASKLAPMFSGGERPSVWEGLLQQIGPALPEIASTVKTGLEVVKARLGSIPAAPPPVNVPNILAPGAPTPAAASLPPGGVPTMNPIIKEMCDAIANDNKAYYGKLEQVINTYVGAHAIPALVGGSLPVENFLAQVAQGVGVPYLATRPAIDYFNGFLATKRPADVPPQTPSQQEIPGYEQDKVAAKCKACGSVYSWPTEQEWNADSKICDCSGELERTSVPNSSQGEPQNA